MARISLQPARKSQALLWAKMSTVRHYPVSGSRRLRGLSLVYECASPTQISRPAKLGATLGLRVERRSVGQAGQCSRLLKNLGIELEEACWLGSRTPE